MINNVNANEFIDHTTYEDCAVMFEGKKFFFYGMTYDKDTNMYTYAIDEYINDEFIQNIFSEDSTDKNSLVEKALNSKIFNGKTFWEAEKGMEWIEW